MAEEYSHHSSRSLENSDDFSKENKSEVNQNISNESFIGKDDIMQNGDEKKILEKNSQKSNKKRESYHIQSNQEEKTNFIENVDKFLLMKEELHKNSLENLLIPKENEETNKKKV